MLTNESRPVYLQGFFSSVSGAEISIHVMSLKWASGRFFLHFREIFEKCIEYIGKFLVHFREILNFCEKVVHFRQILPLISWSLPDDEGGITCMNKAPFPMQIK